MVPERPTRACRKEQTRERLYDAARTVFLVKGVTASSVEDIVEAAGYSRGAFYSNFTGKHELLTELLRRDAGRALNKLQTIVQEGGTPEETKVWAIAYYCCDYLQGDCFPLWVEAQLLARRDGAFRERVLAFRRAQLEQVSACIRTLLPDSNSALPLPVDALVHGLMSLCDGLRLFTMARPQSETDPLTRAVLAEFVSCVLGRDRETKRHDEHPASAIAP